MAREFYQEAWRRGFDIKFGLAAIVMQALCMAPISALGVVAMFYLLRQVFRSDHRAFWLALLYAFGTPVFFRAAYLNHNMILGHFALMGFLVIWNPGDEIRRGLSVRFFAGGLAGGAALLLDYSGVVLLTALFCYAVAKASEASSLRHVIRGARAYVLGAAGPILLLWFYQYESFGNPFLPGQHWMPPVEWIDFGYQELLPLHSNQNCSGAYWLTTATACSATCPLMIARAPGAVVEPGTETPHSDPGIPPGPAGSCWTLAILRRDQLRPAAVQQRVPLSVAGSAIPVPTGCASPVEDASPLSLSFRGRGCRSSMVDGHVSRRRTWTGSTRTGSAWSS